ncbi:radical SAM protein [Ruminiclostridium cellobioparum]|uniref:radical SAM protein n=1 Tax=Ruminiclostridium cellobioparum TaxID=29355 RepID=UPI0028B049DF|nr:radical SAM protein [Ruminiclostridium cellobioparum]
MNAYVDKIAEKIVKEKRDVIIYGADTDALLFIKTLKRLHNTVPTCLCDGDKKKWHKSLLNVKILPPSQAISQFPEAIFLIASGLYKAQIIGSLLSSGKVLSDRIINYEPVDRRRSCVYLESYIVCFGHKLNFCCSDFGKNKSPHIEFNGDYEYAVQEFITYREKLISNLNNNVPTPCDGCPYIKEDWYLVDAKISIFNDGEEGICNFNCSYCNSDAKTSRDISNDINMQKLLNIFNERKLLSKELRSIVSCGEISVHPRRNEIYDFICQLRNSICTNASVYDRKLLQLLELGNTDLVVSMDAGTKSTFKKVKGHDLFDKVCNNLKIYSSIGEVKLKYIILPGINDNETDIDGFVSLCKDIGTKLVQISYNLNAPPELSYETVNAIKYFVKRLSENGIIYRIISDVISKTIIESEEVE